MFNRRFLREKTIQAYYGFVQGGAESAVACRQNMLAGLDRTAELYYLQLLLLVALAEQAGERHRKAAERGVQSDKDLESVRRMADNRVVSCIKQDPNYQLKSEAYRLNGTKGLNDIVVSVYDTLFVKKNGESAADKVWRAILEDSGKTDDFERDREFLRKLYKRKISGHPVLRSFCEERSIFWESDYESATFWVYSLLGQMTPERNNNVDAGWSVQDEAVEFGITLLDKTLLHKDEYDAYIAERLQNWNHERIGTLEKVLLCIAMSEFINFPSIPVKVTLNEYIELAKRFCAQESPLFVNGVLHKIAQDLKADKKMKKSGRGLIG